MIQSTLFNMKGKTRSTKEADKLLRKTRSNLIARGIEVAKAFALKHGVVTSRDVLAVMGNEIPKDIRPLWVGRVFANNTFEWTGRYESYRDSERNIHERTVKVWRLKAA